jgi:threonine/homoserine/homoserine lactone efflux protein
MCGTPFWGVAGAVGCAYLSYLSYSRLREGDLSWSHDWQSILTGAVWIVLIAGLLSETRCWRERIFFGFVFVNFTLWFVISVWTSAPISAVRDLRKLSFALWALAAAASIMTIFGSKALAGTPTEDRDSPEGEK